MMAKNKEKKRSAFMSLIVTVTIAVVVSMGGTYFLLKYMNAPTKSQVTNKITRTMAILIRPGSNATFPLKGGNQVLVVDSLSFLVGSSECSQKIGLDKPQIMDGIQMLILNKSPSEILNPDGLQSLKQQISDLIDQITGFTGSKAPLGVLQVYFYIKAVSSV